MATTVTKTYSIKIKYSRDDEVDLVDTDLEYTELRKIILKSIGETVPISQGIISAHAVGSVSES